MSANTKELIKMRMKKLIPSINVEFGDSCLTDILLFLIIRKIGTIKVTSIKELITVLNGVAFISLINELPTLNNVKSKNIVTPMIEYRIIEEFTTTGNKRKTSVINKAMKRTYKYLDTYKIIPETL